MRTRKLLVATITAGALVLAACGSDSKSADSSSSNSTAATTNATDAGGSIDPAAAVAAIAAAKTPDEIIDAVIAQLKSTGQKFDENCVRDALKKMDYAKIAAGGGAPSPEESQKAIQAAVKCFQFGS